MFYFLSFEIKLFILYSLNLNNYAEEEKNHTKCFLAYMSSVKFVLTSVDYIILGGRGLSNLSF